MWKKMLSFFKQKMQTLEIFGSISKVKKERKKKIKEKKGKKKKRKEEGNEVRLLE